MVNYDRNADISVPLAVGTACRFGIQIDTAETIAKEMLAIVRNNWERLAKEHGLTRGQIESMRPAFNECYR